MADSGNPIDMEDLQAAIDASAAHVGSRKKPAVEVESEVKETESKESTPVEVVVKKPEASPAKPVQSEPSTEHAVEVKIGKPANTTADQDQESEHSDASDETPEHPKIVLNHNRVQKPSADITPEEQPAPKQEIVKPQEAEEKSVKTEEAEENTESEKPEEKKNDEPKPMTTPKKKVIAPISNIHKNEDGTISTGDDDNKKKEDDKKEEPAPGIKIDGLAPEKPEVEEQDGIDQNAVVVYDTKEYYLPIKANRHHIKGGLSKKHIVIMAAILVIAGAAFAAISMGLLPV